MSGGLDSNQLSESQFEGIEVKYTGLTPICPYCDKPTVRSSGMSATTLLAYIPIYNEEGINTNPDKNITTSKFNCHTCNREYIVCSQGSKSWYK